jgi:hypothetical protein
MLCAANTELSYVDFLFVEVVETAAVPLSLQARRFDCQVRTRGMRVGLFVGRKNVNQRLATTHNTRRVHIRRVDKWPLPGGGETTETLPDQRVSKYSTQRKRRLLAPF